MAAMTFSTNHLVIALISLSLSHLSLGMSMQTSDVTSNTTMDFLQMTLAALDRTMIFFRREHHDVNLDTVIGTRIVEATMNVILSRAKSSNLGKEVPASVLDHITRLRDESSEISNITVPFIYRNQPDYFAKIGPILRAGLFQLDYDSRDVAQKGVVWPYNPEEVMKEDDSDDCLSEVFGTSTGTTCDISMNCWRPMTNMGYNGYSLSHQIFYLEIAEGYGCLRQMQAFAWIADQPSVGKFHDVFCANMLAEAELIALAKFPMRYQDLFMEQAALCGILGYRGFFKSDWLEAILSWQDIQDGCYKWDAWPEAKLADSTPPPLHLRHKREEQRVSHGCLCHRTSVAASCLAQYVRYILEAWLEEEGKPPL